MSEIVPIRNGGAVARYEPEKGLKEISVAEAAEKHYARAKDATRLLKAMELKLKAIRQFVLWWDGQPDKLKGRPEKRRSTATLIAGQNGMPERFTIERWRDRTKGEAAFAKALVDAKHRAQRIGDLENANKTRYAGVEGLQPGLHKTSSDEPQPFRRPQCAALLRRPRPAWREPPWLPCAYRPSGRRALPQFRPSALRLRSSRAQNSWRVRKFRPKANDTQIVFGITKRSRSRSTWYREPCLAVATNSSHPRQGDVLVLVSHLPETP